MTAEAGEDVAGVCEKARCLRSECGCAAVGWITPEVRAESWDEEWKQAEK